jgi:hypothetical protein
VCSSAIDGLLSLNFTGFLTRHAQLVPAHERMTTAQPDGLTFDTNRAICASPCSRRANGAKTSVNGTPLWLLPSGAGIAPFAK